MPEWLPNPEIVIGIASACAAWLALLLAIFSLRSSQKAVQISELQEARHRPILVPYLYDGYFRDASGRAGRLYAFLISMSNRSDSNNAIATAELRLTYVTHTGLQLILKVRMENELENEREWPFGEILRLPSRVDAHQTIQGWCRFSVDAGVLANVHHIDSYMLTFTDTHGNRSDIEPIMVREFTDAPMEQRTEVRASDAT